jgi:hypothetical protein
MSEDGYWQPVEDSDEERAAFYAAYPYMYVNRWYDEDGIAHYFGINTEYPTLKEAREKLTFSLIATPVDLVYGPCMTDDELYAYLHDVSNNPSDDDDPDNLGSVGTLDWL